MIVLGFLLQDAEEFAVENEDIFMQINNLSLSDESSEAKEDTSSKDENDAIITNLGTLWFLINVQQTLLFFGKSSYLHGLIRSYTFINF